VDDNVSAHPRFERDVAKKANGKLFRRRTSLVLYSASEQAR
jgi:hypothetical protein